MSIRIATILLFVLALVTSALAGPVATFQGLGQLEGRVFSGATAISADGSTVVGNAFDETGSQAFRWTRTDGMKSLGRIGGDVSRNIAFGVNADGSVIVGRDEQPDNMQAFRWTSALGMTGAGSPTSEFNAVSADGSVSAGRFTSTGNPLAATWTPTGGGWNELNGAVPDSNSFGISDDGSVVVGTSQNHAFRWTAAGGIVDIGPTGRVPTHSIARDVSADGSVVVGDGGDPERAHAFRWTAAGGLQFLTPVDPNVDTFAYATDGDGSTIVGEVLSTNPFIWDAQHGMRNLQTLLANQSANVHGWTELRPFGISADGQTIVGDGRNPSGNTEAWIATLAGPAAIPLPSALPTGAVLLAIISLSLAGRGRGEGRGLKTWRRTIRRVFTLLPSA